MHKMKRTGYESAKVTLPPLPAEPTQNEPVQTDTAPSEPVQTAYASSAPNPFQESFPDLFAQSSVSKPEAKTVSDRWKTAMDAVTQNSSPNENKLSDTDSQGAA